MMDFQNKSFAGYQLHGMLGEGAFACVYEGEDVKSKQRVAIKIFKSIFPDKATLDSLRREADICKGLKHPNIVRVHRFDIERGTPYMVMDYLPYSWRQKYLPGTRLPLPQVVQYLKQLGGALQHAHNEMVIHRDLKPGNLLLDNNNTLFLTDFSIARVLGPSGGHITQNISGTLPYMAPEAFEKKKLERATDQYSLGVVVYEWLTGKVPFHGDKTQLEHLHGSMQPPPSMRQIVPDLPQAVENAVLQTLEKDPSKRFHSVDAFVHYFEQAANQVYQMPIQPNQSQPIYLQTTQPAVHPSSLITQTSPAISHPSSSIPTQPGTQQANLNPPVFANGSASGQTTTVPISAPSAANQQATNTQNNAPTVQQGATLPGTTMFGDQSLRGKVAKGVTLCVYPEHLSKVKEICWLPPQGAQIHSVDNLRAHTWDAQFGSPSVSIPLGGQNGVWSPDRRYLAYANYEGIHVDAMLGTTPTPSPHGPYQGHKYDVQAIAWRGSSGYIASGGKDRQVHIWNPASGQLLGSVPPNPYQGIYSAHTRPVTHLAFSLDGSWIASAQEEGEIHVWNPDTGLLLISYGDHQPNVQPNVNGQRAILSLHWSPDGRRIASQAGREIRVWDVMTGKTRAVHHIPPGDFPIAWSPNGRRIACRSLTNKSVDIWSPSARKRLITCYCEWPLVAIAWSPNGKMLATAAGPKVHIWDAASGRRLYSYTRHDAHVTSVAWSPDGRQIASADEGGRTTPRPSIFVWQARGIEPPPLRRGWDRVAARFRKIFHIR